MSLSLLKVCDVMKNAGGEQIVTSSRIRVYLNPFQDACTVEIHIGP